MCIYLMGLMGAGKTYWGSRWAAHYGAAFVDLDEYIVNKYGRSVRSIFESDGEEQFRLMEREALQSIPSTQDTIIALGGGTPCFHENIHWIKTHGTSLYLEAAPAFLAERLESEKTARPLLTEYSGKALITRLEQLRNEREIFFKQADYIFPVKDCTINSLDFLFLQNKSYHA